MTEHGIRIPIFLNQGKALLDEHEPAVAWAISYVFDRAQGAVLDVGANIGQTLLKIIRIDRERPYYGFDVSPACVAYVRRIIAENSLENHVVLPFGLGAEEGILPILSKDPFDDMATVVEGFRSDALPAHRDLGLIKNGDAVISELGCADISLIKIDVEGGEADVLEGVSGTLRRTRPYVICEVLPSAHLKDESIVRMRKERAARIMNLMSTLDFRIFRIHPDCRLEPVSSFELPGFHLSLCNYMFIPKEKVEPAA